MANEPNKQTRTQTYYQADTWHYFQLHQMWYEVDSSGKERYRLWNVPQQQLLATWEGGTTVVP